MSDHPGEHRHDHPSKQTDEDSRFFPTAPREPKPHLLIGFDIPEELVQMALEKIQANERVATITATIRVIAEHFVDQLGDSDFIEASCMAVDGAIRQLAFADEEYDARRAMAIYDFHAF